MVWTGEHENNYKRFSSFEIPMNVSDAVLALLLAANIHGTEAAVVSTAKRCAQRMPRSKRFLMYSVMDSRDPLHLLRLLVTDLDEWHELQCAASTTEI